MHFQIDVFTWIPLPDVPNPLHALPGGTARFGPGACGPRFGGDSMRVPPADPALWTSSTFRARQCLSFEAASFGAPPVTMIATGCVPGLTTVLTAPRSRGGRVCHSLTAAVVTSSGSVRWSAGDRWYAVRLHGEARDPVPAAALRYAAGSPGGAVGVGLTPNLEWVLDLRISDATTIPATTRMRYGISRALPLDRAAATFPGTASVGTGGRLVHGLLTLRYFPSLVVYLTVTDAGARASTPLYFADAISRPLLSIAAGQTDVLRTVTW